MDLFKSLFKKLTLPGFLLVAGIILTGVVRDDHVDEPYVLTYHGKKKMYYTFGIGGVNADSEDSAAKLYRSLGVTSIETYVTWETCERKGEGLWDWSKWDKNVKVLKENDLKWVPFLILGPAYSTPDWFRKSEEHIPCRCLEHGIESKIESLWNPNLPNRIERFMAAFSKRYRDSGIIESVLLGIQGDFGEAIYSVWGGGWTFNIPGKYHNHPGFWCDDLYALTDFREFLKKRYITITKLNTSWGTEFDNFDNADFPARKDHLIAFEEKVKSGDPLARRRWLDFIDWYRDAMTNFAEWWIRTARSYFPHTPIYLCTGGDSKPRYGSNFAEQVRVAAKYDAGVRITNEGSDYSQNFALTRWVASAGKHYGTYYGFEPAGMENEKGIIARIYNATASGANQLHDYAGNVTGTQERIEVQQKHLKYLYTIVKPVVPVALWYPNVSLTLNWEVIESPHVVNLNAVYLNMAGHFRDYTDFDYVDESMLRTGALKNYRILVIIKGKVMETSDAKRIADWIRKGGRVIVMDIPRFESVDGTKEPERILFGNKLSTIRKSGKGKIVRVRGWARLSEVLRENLTGLNLPACDLAKDNVFVTQIEKRKWIILNNNGKESVVRFVLPDGSYSSVVKPETITEINLAKDF